MVHLGVLVPTFAAAWTFPSATWARSSSFRSHGSTYLNPRQGPSSPFDHSSIKSYAALGDSFAAGIGAGARLTGWGDYYCSRYDSSYPSIINADPSLGDSKGRSFQYFACSGAVTADVVKSQIPGLKDSSLDLVTLTIGGNDAKLSDVLHACIYQWNKDPKLDCDKTLSEVGDIIEDPKFAANYDRLLQDLAKKLKGDAKIYFTGYSRFWDASTDACDKVTWAFKYNYGLRQYLTQARRTKMNNLVEAVNQQIQNAVKRLGDQAAYVPWGAGVDFIDGHFCEPGVDESNAIDREQTIFYEWGSTLDDQSDKLTNSREKLKSRQLLAGVPEPQNLNNTWEGQIAAWVLEAIQQGAQPEDFQLEQQDVVNIQSGLLLPDKYGRIFHPQKFGHLVIAEAVIRTMDDVAAKKASGKGATTTLVGCPVPTGPASHIGQKDSCATAYTSDSEGTTFTVGDGTTAIKSFCLKHRNETVRTGDGAISEGFPNGKDTGSWIVLSASLDTTPDCQSFDDIGKWNFFDCSSNMNSAMNDCDPDTTTEKKGGGRTADCITYNIRATRKMPAGSSQPQPSYAPGTCSLHLEEITSPDDGSATTTNKYKHEFSVEVFDNKKTSIGKVQNETASDERPLEMKTKMRDTLIITPLGQEGQVQFVLGTYIWKSSPGDECTAG
ncbi:MAG: hypothetical protein Q9219_007626, partial [cf. Caloplaca sp. 3 TL-2023]